MTSQSKSPRSEEELRDALGVCCKEMRRQRRIRPFHKFDLERLEVASILVEKTQKMLDTDLLDVDDKTKLLMADIDTLLAEHLLGIHTFNAKTSGGTR